ncbi:MAG: mannose-1-phosphate guanylyltransferase/mannose-6-phosphate isomerase [Gammaproteobacteria bacterium]|nr:mannose-1-phosphate guanylyltransferase/mannose-6-phosphate isomerase [Gammaproteobacteria bacterium]
MLIIPTILCGGAGSRLWPVSRELHPKPFIRLQDGQSLLQKAFLRAKSLPDVTEILTVTNQELFFKTQDEYKEINQEQVLTSYILEPCGRNTAAAIAIAAMHIKQRHGDEAIMLILPADHLIQDETAFHQAVFKAIKLAARGMLVTFGIEPVTPETGYGYIEVDEAHPLQEEGKDKNACLGYPISRFIEKPDLNLATQYLEAGGYLWNAGLFCFQVDTVLKQMRQHCPLILEAAKATLEASLVEKTQTWVQCRLDEKMFIQVPEDSFDYAVMEPASKQQTHGAEVAVVPCNIGWRDIGSWQSIGELSEPDENGNRVNGEALFHSAVNCYVHSPDRMVGLVGVDNLIVIDTPDALLVADKNLSQEVKHLYGMLKANGHETHKTHRTVYRPWGTYTILEDSDRYKIKRIEVNPRASLSLQMHHHRSEHWIVVSGTARVVNGEQSFLLGVNESTYIAAGYKHRLENPGIVKLVMIEVQSGEYLGEDDIVRFQDHYGRVQAEEELGQPT